MREKPSQPRPRRLLLAAVEELQVLQAAAALEPDAPGGFAGESSGPFLGLSVVACGLESWR